VDVGAAQELGGDLPGGLQPPLPAPALLVEPRVVDRHPGRGRQRDDRPFVVGGERVIAAQVQASEHLAAHQQRDPEEGPHRRVARREPAGRRVGGQVRQPHRSLSGHQLAEHPVPGRWRADPRPGRVVDAGGGERGRPAVLVEQGQRAVAGADQAGGGGHDPLQGGVELQTGGKGEDGHRQRVHPVPARCALLGHGPSLAQRSGPWRDPAEPTRVRNRRPSPGHRRSFGTWREAPAGRTVKLVPRTHSSEPSP
jgi:hypothetical protein